MKETNLVICMTVLKARGIATKGLLELEVCCCAVVVVFAEEA